MQSPDVTLPSAAPQSRAVIPAAAATQGSGRQVHLISLGCSRNRVDAEVMLGGMISKG